MYEFESNEEILEIIDNSGEVEKMAEVLTFIWDESKKYALSITDYKWKSLVNHIAAMTERSKTGELLEGIEADMFTEISADSLELAKQVAERIGNLPENEMYLLSVHFEAAK